MFVDIKRIVEFESSKQEYYHITVSGHTITEWHRPIRHLDKSQTNMKETKVEKLVYLLTNVFCALVSHNSGFQLIKSTFQIGKSSFQFFKKNIGERNTA